jgi:hypothetical protein
MHAIVKRKHDFSKAVLEDLCENSKKFLHKVLSRENKIASYIGLPGITGKDHGCEAKVNGG